MRPHVILHNSISLDGSITGFQPDLNAHYAIVGGLRHDAYLMGSVTAETSIHAFMGPHPPQERPEDLRPKAAGAGRPVWIIPDSGGRLHGKLHLFRSSEHCPALMLLVARETPARYLRYLQERAYPYLASGSDKVDFEEALPRLRSEHGIETVLLDSGPVLAGLFLDKGLVDEVSLLVHPVIVGRSGRSAFSAMAHGGPLARTAVNALEQGLIHIRYDLARPPEATGG